MIICCYTEMHEATEKSLKLYAPGVISFNVDGDAFEYWRTLRCVWGVDDYLITIEHDIEIHEGVIPGFQECPGDWCVFPYKHRRKGDDEIITLTMSLGCTKLSAKARAMATEAEIRDVDSGCTMCHIGATFEGLAACWLHIDAKLSALLEFKGLSPCIHEPEVIHHHEFAEGGKIELPC